MAAPAYNEEAGIREVVNSWIGFLRKSSDVHDFEIVVCNDGSDDNTGEILRELANANPELRLVDFKQNQGAAVALTAAIKATLLDWVMLIDSDGQFPIENLSLLLPGLRRDGTSAVIGTRKKKDSTFRRFGTWSSGVVCNLVYGTRLKDFNSACKLVSGPLLRSLNFEAKGMNSSTEITGKLLEAEIDIVQVEILHRPRTSGTSSIRLVRDASHRLLFVCYLAFRRLLIRLGILQQPLKQTGCP
ncbi:glycosyltransferase family 2 protein [Bradyrhizobium sp. C-145]|uniref:glycosyltransferase family 2 protein n=1 Tax=Bradyrhizobium sp. C-145 TaxID=574727 RepID=UPI00201B85C8|nr:glycosyltransferase family 2 protein [Bradyrhizobium sp. C-145]UQR61350.1 glycosyltransferase family 2 protein [Bradyrhizobium sp. C-145]